MSKTSVNWQTPAFLSTKVSKVGDKDDFKDLLEMDNRPLRIDLGVHSPRRPPQTSPTRLPDDSRPAQVQAPSTRVLGIRPDPDRAHFGPKSHFLVQKSVLGTKMRFGAQKLFLGSKRDFGAHVTPWGSKKAFVL